MDYDVIVVGGGASGLICAGTAASRGLSVLLLEKMHMPARKLRISGKGRCNITNIAPKHDFMQHIGPDSRFLYNAFGTFFSEELLNLFDSIGIKTVTEQGGRVFPESGKATEVVDALLSWTQKNGVHLRCNTIAQDIVVENGKVTGIVTTARERIVSNSVVIATGGLSYPATGSTGDGYRIARKAGHTVHPLRPMLVPLLSNDTFIKYLDGLHLKNISVSVFIDGIRKHDLFGELEFMENALTGPVILSLSRKIIDEVQAKKKIVFHLDLKPALDHAKLDARLLRDLNNMGKESFYVLLRGLLPSQLIPVFAGLLQISNEKKCSQITAEQRKKIAGLLRDFPININGHRDYNEAIITGGGVSLREIHPGTMESKLIKNLYFTGEILDLDADTGGYNLQIAFSTGYLAGISVQKPIQ
ncbi:MAG TPA: NAD(P)/FAD-dependent oxidoreductase [Bacteroidales bacterium]|nr:NAD(P)/FAD-dependent oxidoreductase [Bacteroidales bacterium]